jgi:hypothetical protein
MGPRRSWVQGSNVQGSACEELKAEGLVSAEAVSGKKIRDLNI